MSVAFETAPVTRAGKRREGELQPKEHPFGRGPRSFVLADETIQAMANATNWTRNNAKEAGFSYCIDPARNVQGVSKKFAILKSAPRCTGTACQMPNELPDCPDEKIVTDIFEWISPGKPNGNFHTHPNGDPAPSDADVLSQLFDPVLYGNDEALGCVTAPTGTKGIPEEDMVEHKEDVFDPTVCWVIPKTNLPTVDEFMELNVMFNDKVGPYYDEYERTGTEPDPEQWPEAVEALQTINGDLDKRQALVAFNSLDDLSEAKPSVQLAGGSGKPRNYFKVSKVKLNTKRQAYEPGFAPYTGEKGYDYEPRPPAQPKVTEVTTFAKEFGSLEDCIRGVFPGGGKMSTAQLKRIATANGIDSNLSRREICETLAVMESLVHA